VVFPYVDRFARNVEGGLATIRQFREAGAEVLWGDLGWYSDETNFKMQMYLFLMIAEQQRDSIVEKSRGAVATKIKRGLAHGGYSPFGWHFVTALEIAAAALKASLPVPEGKPQNVHVVVERDRDTMRLIGLLVLNGASARAVCRELAARGILSPQGKLTWNPTTVTKLVRDPVYSSAVWHYNKREMVAPKKVRNPLADRHRVKSTWKPRPQSEWIPQQLPGGPLWTHDYQDAVIAALERNGRVSVGEPAAADGNEAMLKSLVKCNARVKATGERCGRAVAPRQKTYPNGTRLRWYGCTHRDRVRNHHLCEGHLIRAEVLEDAVWDGVGAALSQELDGLVMRYREAIAATVDAEELGRLKAREQKLVRMKQEAQDKELEADDADDKRHYAERVAGFKGELLLLRRRILSFTAASHVADVDTATISREVKASWRTTNRARRRQLLVGWVEEIWWAHDEAEITLRVPLQDANRQPGVGHVGASNQQYRAKYCQHDGERRQQVRCERNHRGTRLEPEADWLLPFWKVRGHASHIAFERRRLLRGDLRLHAAHY
jgi:hypothetical protein